MAGFETALSFLPVITQGASLINNAISKDHSARDQEQSQKLALQQLKEQQDESLRRAQEDADAQRANIALQSQTDEQQRRDALKRAVARQRAEFGASGLSPTGGSADAVLLGLFDETERDRAARDALDNWRFNTIDQNLMQQSRQNVLQRTQLEQKQKLNGLSGYNDDFKTGIGAANWAYKASTVL
jgi:hypothetical protein